MSELWLTRARLKSGALKPLVDRLLKREGDDHHLVWSLFEEDADAKRDFLYRVETVPGDGERPGAPTFYVLSQRRPNEASQLFRVESQPFAPELAPGDHLKFDLRANPVIRTKHAERKRSSGKNAGEPVVEKRDVIMAAIYGCANDQRAARRDEAVVSQSMVWFEKQGAQHGFALVRRDVHHRDGEVTADVPSFAAGGYRTRRIFRRYKSAMAFATVDLSGEIEVTDPASFLDALGRGFGSARAFGCGLMLIRRARR